YGIIYHEALWGKIAIAIGAVISLAALIGWGIEPLEEPMKDHGEHSEPPVGAIEQSEGGAADTGEEVDDD
ncbi:MAG: hypothetical protein WEF28_13060, partial [Acidimicrobiia bacterium]